MLLPGRIASTTAKIPPVARLWRAKNQGPTPTVIPAKTGIHRFLPTPSTIRTSRNDRLKFLRLLRDDKFLNGRFSFIILLSCNSYIIREIRGLIRNLLFMCFVVELVIH
jgi:hypothetical protein